MTEEEEKSRGFKVADRRRFSSEGEAKADQQDRVDERPEEIKKPAAAKPAESQAQSTPKIPEEAIPSPGEQAEASAAYEKAASSQPSPDLGPHDITFASFIVGLSTEALALLGEMPHPATGERIQDLGGAQQIIDIIGILRDKTRGNLSRDEDSLLDAILFDLRMKYVEKARQAPR